MGNPTDNKNQKEAGMLLLHVATAYHLTVHYTSVPFSGLVSVHFKWFLLSVLLVVL